jgi:uncharacterized protein (TIGR03435 family)
MKRDDDNLDKKLHRHLGLFGAPSPSQLDVSRGRVREWLGARVETPAATGAADARASRTVHHIWRLGLSMAAAAMLIVLVSMGRWPGAESMGRVEAADGSLYSLSAGTRQALNRGDSIDANAVLHANGGSGAMLALADGSRVEMRSQSELSFERAGDDVRIRLDTGGIIVNASTQPSGLLYVQTKDMMVAVAGTAFVANAAEAGSRVSVIEGEVRVHEGDTETTLRPGEQVSTNYAVAARPVADEIAWSRRADGYRAILANFARGMALSAGPLTPLTDAPDSANTAFEQRGATAAPVQPAAARPQFEEASVRTCDPDNIPEPPAGSRGGGANSFQMTPGRTHALCLTLATILRHAYGYGPVDVEVLNPGGRGRGRGFALNTVYGLGVEDGRRVRGGPDWVRSERYTIDAVADGAADAATMSGPMLRDLLERRFKLKVHVETEQIPAWALTVAPGGLKIKEGICTPADPSEPRLTSTAQMARRNLEAARRGETTAGPCGFAGMVNGPNRLFVGAGTGVPAVGGFLGAPVIDRTGIPSTVRFNYVLEFAPDERTPGPLALRQSTEPSDIPRAPDLFTALEQQLGLKLEPAKAPREFIVIDQVERPDAN